MRPLTVLMKSRHTAPPTNLNFDPVTIKSSLTGYDGIDSIVTTMTRVAGYTLAVLSTVTGAALALAQTPAPTAAQALKSNFAYINNKILEMAQDFPVEKYDYKLKPEMRSFGAVIVHIAGGNTYAGKAGKGEKVKWDDQEQDPKKFPEKADVVAMFKKSLDEANAALAQNPEGPQKNMQPFLSVIQHSSEHYGLLVAYYRANGLVPPESRPKK
jgi:hypothetical protein